VCSFSGKDGVQPVLVRSQSSAHAGHFRLLTMWIPHDPRTALRARGPGQRLNRPISVAFASVLKLRLNPTSAADVSDVTGSVACETANTVKM
jgi:hypothetical protein